MKLDSEEMPCTTVPYHRTALDSPDVYGAVVERPAQPEPPRVTLVADLEERRFKSEWLARLVERLESRQRVAPDVADAYWIVAAEIATGIDLSGLKPQVDDNWVSPAAISQRTGVPVQRVSRAISELGLRGNRAGLCRPLVTKDKARDRTVTSYLYSPRAVAQIEAVLAHCRTRARRLGPHGSALEAG